MQLCFYETPYFSTITCRFTDDGLLYDFVSKADWGDPRPPQLTSGVRLGTSAGTARGLDATSFGRIGDWIADVLEGLAGGDPTDVVTRVRPDVAALAAAHPIYPHLTERVHE